MKKTIHKNDLIHGEMYETTQETKWSTWIEVKNNEGVITKSTHGEVVIVPTGTRLLFRSFAPYVPNPDYKLAVFYDFERKSSICLATNEKQCVLSLRHVPWELRNEIKTEKQPEKPN